MGVREILLQVYCTHVFYPQEEVKAKRPPGAVSMFGVVDIAAAVKKRADSLSPEGKQEVTAGNVAA